MKDTLKRLKAITKDCRENMHEPDEQELSAHVIGDHLDNAFGDRVIEKQLINGYHELVVVLKKDGETETFNLATLIALARKADLKK